MRKKKPCPHCQGEYADLKAHIRRMHPETLEESTPEQPSEQPPENMEAEAFELKTPENKESPSTGYHCVGCGATINKGQNPCPSCGEELDWGALNA